MPFGVAELLDDEVVFVSQVLNCRLISNVSEEIIDPAIS